MSITFRLQVSDIYDPLPLPARPMPSFFVTPSDKHVYTRDPADGESTQLKVWWYIYLCAAKATHITSD